MQSGRVEHISWVEEASEARAAAAARSAMAFAAARRHSSLVRGLRIALLAGSFGAIAVVIGLTLFRTFGPRIEGLSIGAVSINGTKVTMDKPRLTGSRPDGSSYVINAREAIQDIGDPTQIDLVEIDGDIGQRDQAATRLSASTGRYDSAKDLMDLAGVVRLRNSSYTVDLKSAHIDFKSGVYITREPVTVVTNSGTSIVADSAEARDNASLLTFEGHVKTQIPPRGDDQGATAEMKVDPQ